MDKIFYGYPISYGEFAMVFNDGELVFDLNEIHSILMKRLNNDSIAVSLLLLETPPETPVESKDEMEFLIGNFTSRENKTMVRLSRSSTKSMLEELGLDPSDCDIYLVDSAKACFV